MTTLSFFVVTKVTYLVANSNSYNICKYYLVEPDRILGSMLHK